MDILPIDLNSYQQAHFLAVAPNNKNSIDITETVSAIPVFYFESEKI